MTGEVKLLKQVRLSNPKFEDLKNGEGTTRTDGTRIKIGYDAYLHFQTDGHVFLNTKPGWPSEEIKEVRKFRLIAEEI